MECPNCFSENTRRGGKPPWIVDLIAIGFAIPAVYVFDADVVAAAGITITVIAGAHLAIYLRAVCDDCGWTWRVG